MAYTHMNPGEELEVSARAFVFAKDLNIAEYTAKSLEEIETLIADSITKEEEIFSRMKQLESEWTTQAEQTYRLRAAREYKKTTAVEHTANQWTVSEYGTHIISNMVYAFFWRMDEDTKWDKKLGKLVPIAWRLTWSVWYNLPRNSDWRKGGHIAGQDRKKFDGPEAREKYLQGRIKAYSKLFTEICPPIPAEDKQCFCVNGVLLPGYTVSEE